MVEQHYCLRWNNYRTNITAEFETLREGEHFVDVTLACDGLQLKAHKVVLSACSPYFKELLQANPCTHPIIILRDVAYSHMRSLLEFMYAGEVNVSQAQLGSFLHTAEALKIRGLAESSENRKCGSIQPPLSSLKSPLENYRGISLALGSDSIVEQPVNPFLMQCSDKNSSQPPHSPPLPPLDPSYKALPGISPIGEGGRRPLCVSNPNEELRSKSPVSASLSAPHGQQGVVVKGEVIESGENISPSSLPPNKRHCSEQRLSARAIKIVGSEASSNIPQNGCSHLPQTCSSINNAPTDLRTPATLGSNTLGEDCLDKIPKTEPYDPALSDPEGSGGGGWPEESDTGGGDGGDEVGGRESGSSGGGGSGGGCSGFGAAHLSPPRPAPDKRTPANSSHGNSSSSEADNPSHLAHALGSESHMHGPLQPEVDGHHPYAFDGKPDAQLELRRMRPDSMPSSPPLPPSSLPHSCQLCGKLISCRRNLWKHMERVHFTNPTVRCPLCAKMFKNKYALKDHQRIYHGGLSQVPQSRVQHSGPSSLLSRILQDSRHGHPSDPPHDVLLPHLSSPPSGALPSHAHFFASQRPPAPAQLDSDKSCGLSANIASSSSLEINPQILSHSLPPMSGALRSSATGRPPSSEWSMQEELYPLQNHSLLGDVHQLVTKSD